ncbi:MAG TPA: ATP-binding protein [Propionibacteriaceae bacterium]
MRAQRRRYGISVRLRITATVALLVALTLSGAGLIVYTVESQRIEAQSIDEVNQELDEFALLQGGRDPETGQPFQSVRDILTLFLRRNVPDDDELLVGWIGNRPELRFPPRDPFVFDPAFLAAAAPLARSSGSTYLDTTRGAVLISSQSVRKGNQLGALIVVVYLDEDRAELLDTLRTYAIVAGLSLLLVTAAAFWQSGRLLAPLRVLRETAEEISETDLSRRIPLTANDDITALTRTVNHMLDRLDAAFTGQRQFLDDAGHELRTPLTVLRGHLELLDASNERDVVETRDLLLEEVDRMSRLVGDLLFLAKSDRPDFVTFGPVDLGALTADLLAKARALGDREWVLDAQAVGSVHADQQRITQAVLQLADNAVKHTDQGDVVAIGSFRSGSTVRLWVRDTGPGVAEADRQRIFERFGRSHVPDHDDGFGLGLSIVRAIASAHGGTVSVEDARPRGSRFVLTLPAVATTTPQGSSWRES